MLMESVVVSLADLAEVSLPLIQPQEVQEETHPLHVVATRPSWCQLIEATAAQVGEHPGGLTTPIKGRLPDGTPWIVGFDNVSLRTEEQMLQAACYVICASLTGMRDSELQSMQVGAVKTGSSADGLIERYKFVARVFKGNRAFNEAEWVTIEAAARAVAILERQVLSHNSQATWLWTPVPHPGVRRDVVGPKMAERLRNFAQHLNRRFGNGSDIIPARDGNVWKFTPRQFRRTSAWFIGNRPFGVVAGKIQYKHASIAAFEGYAGDSESGFPQEIERERALGQLDDILELFDEVQHGAPLAGGAAPRMKRLFASAEAELGTLPGMHADRSRLKVMLKSTARTLHVGLLADCYFDPAAALCLAGLPIEERSKPETGLCQPTRCTNACIGKRHVPDWQAALIETKEFLAQKRLSEVQRAALRSDAKAIEGILADLRDSDAADSGTVAD